MLKLEGLRGVWKTFFAAIEKKVVSLQINFIRIKTRNYYVYRHQ